MRNAMLWMAVPAMLAVAGCRDRDADEEAEAARERPAESRPARAPARSETAPAPAAETAAQEADRPALRFDMTSQDGEVQTAEDFDAWMQAQGVRVAEGRPAGPDAPPAAAQPEAGATRD